MAIAITGSYSGYAYPAGYPSATDERGQNCAVAGTPDSTAESAREKPFAKPMGPVPAGQLEQMLQAGRESNTERIRKYAKELAKLVPNADFKLGTGFAKGAGKTLTVNPGLLVKMMHDPQQAKDTIEMLKGVEFITRSMDSLYKATGKKLVYRHCYIDSDGKYRTASRVIDERGQKMSAAMRKERQLNTAKLIRKTKENAAKRKKAFQKKTGAKARHAAGSVLDLRL